MTNFNQIIKQIEQTYNVNSIKCHNINLWPLLRIYIYDAYNSEKHDFKPRNIIGKDVIKRIIKSIFYYSPLTIFSNKDIWVYCSAESRKIINGKAYQKVSGAVIEQYKSCLVFEDVSKSFHKPKKTTKGESIIGIAILYPFTILYKRHLKSKKLLIENENIINEILIKNNIILDYRSIIINFFASYKSLNLLLKFKRPKIAIIECPYSQFSFGYVYAFKKNKVKVIELQHGVINSSHIAYNSLLKNEWYGNDYLFVFGENDRKCFNTDNVNYININNIRVTGHYLLNKYLKLNINDPFIHLRVKYKKIVLVSGQDDLEPQILNFISIVAKQLLDIAFVYVPRINKFLPKFETDNISIMYHNIYDLIKHCDVHSCVNSTTALESNFLNKYNIFLNIENNSSKYYGSVLNDKYGSYFANNPSEYVELFNNINHNIDAKRNDNCFVYSCDNLMKAHLDEILRQFN